MAQLEDWRKEGRVLKPPATKAAQLLRIKLTALAARGIAGEAESAARKLARLEARYDFTAHGITGEEKGDIFAGCQHCQPSDTARHLCDFGPAESEIATYVQWAIERQARISGSLRTSRDWKLSVWVEADYSAMPRLSVIADTIRRAFVDLWAQFSTAPGVQPGARKQFLRGLFDGMMGEERVSGELLPPVLASRVRTAKGKRKLALAPGITLHPYSCAVELGRKIRLSVPIGEIRADLAAQVEVRAIAA